MTRRDRVLLVLQFLGSVGVAMAVVVLASQLCPGPTPDTPCPDADRNRFVVIALTGVAVAFLIAPLAFVGEYLSRRRIVYGGAWLRAMRRGTWCGLAVAAIAALRLADAVNLFSVAAVVGVVIGVEYLAIRRIDEE